jgi:NAD(P)-dependent dehydrogenase (short-subunit alcohol dehydrogenase family)
MSAENAGRAVLVAGGTGGLGRAVLRALLEAGHPVTSTWRSEAERDVVEGELADAGPLTLLRADLTDPRTVEETVHAVANLGAVVNLVGGYAGGAKVHETAPETLQRMLELNLLPGFLLARAAMPRLAEARGAFVGVSARAALRPDPGAAAYAAAKAGVLAFVQALDAEYRGDGVRCNAVLPSIIDTPANRAAMPHADHSSWVEPDDIASVVRFLVSEQSAATTGAAIPVFGPG